MESRVFVRFLALNFKSDSFFPRSLLPPILAIPQIRTRKISSELRPRSNCHVLFCPASNLRVDLFAFSYLATLIFVPIWDVFLPISGQENPLWKETTKEQKRRGNRGKNPASAHHFALITSAFSSVSGRFWTFYAQGVSKCKPKF